MARALWNAIGLVIFTAWWSLVAMAAMPIRGRRGVVFAARYWSKDVLRWSKVRVSFSPSPVALDARAYVVMANHSSHTDVFALYSTVPIDMQPVAKRELAYIPLFGWLLAMGAAILIDRGDKKKAVDSIERAAAVIRGGRSVLLFPEGTRTPPDVLGPLKKGPFHLALTAGVPILPIGIHGTGAVLLPGDWRIYAGEVQVRMGTPISTEGRNDTPEAREAVMAEVATALKALMQPNVPA